jgi:putative hydrolase of the HAD superfamily
MSKRQIVSFDISEIKAVLFDLDETLIDSVQGHTGAHKRVSKLIREYLEKSKIKIDSKELILQISNLDDTMNKKFIYDRDKWWPDLIHSVAPKISISKGLIKKLTKEYWQSYALNAKPYTDTVPTLNYLKKNYLLGLISDTDHLPGMKRYRIDIQPFKSLFDLTLVSGEETKETKPSAEPFLYAAKKLGINVNECIFIGDKPFADIEGAKKALMKTILIYRRDWGYGIKADYTIRSLSELRDIL